MSTELTLLGVPSSAGAHFAGQERAPAHLRAAGLVDTLTARGRVVRDLGDTTHASFVTDPGQRRSQSLPRVATVAREVAERVADAYASDSTLCVLGGDCSVLLGVASGLLRHVERLGL